MYIVLTILFECKEYEWLWWGKWVHVLCCVINTCLFNHIPETTSFSIYYIHVFSFIDVFESATWWIDSYIWGLHNPNHGSWLLNKCICQCLSMAILILSPRHSHFSKNTLRLKYFKNSHLVLKNYILGFWKGTLRLKAHWEWQITCAICAH